MISVYKNVHDDIRKKERMPCFDGYNENKNPFDLMAAVFYVVHEISEHLFLYGSKRWGVYHSTNWQKYF